MPLAEQIESREKLQVTYLASLCNSKGTNFTYNSKEWEIVESLDYHVVNRTMKTASNPSLCKGMAEQGVGMKVSGQTLLRTTKARKLWKATFDHVLVALMLDSLIREFLN